MKKTKINLTRGFGILENILAKKRADIANKLILDSHKKARILDIGCGTFPYFLTFLNVNEKYGIDPSVNLELSKEEKTNINLKKIKVGEEKLPFKDNFFEVVTMLAVFEHIDHDQLSFVLKEVKRVLNKGGIFIITTPAPWSDKPLHYLANFGLISKEEIHEHKHNLTHKKIIDYLKDVGFSKNKIKNGFFELYMNMWFKAEK
jgi:ubiquinone/menaquinone biosynthesis C-methylase UbiE